MIQVKIYEPENGTLISMADMWPLQIGRVIKAKYLYAPYIGCIVMRTASEEKFEIMNLSDPGPTKCWSTHPEPDAYLVQLLPPDTRIELTITEDSPSEEDY